jgi:hypothetical protein
MAKRALAIAGLAVAGAQAGHLVAYQLRYGAAAAQLESTGAHAYYPALVKTVLGAAALVVIGALLVIAAARIAEGGQRRRIAAGPSFLNLLAVLFTLQLGWYIGQELTEAMVAGVAPDSGANLLLWGMVGQLPVALVATLVLKWLAVRFEAAVAALRWTRVLTLAAPAMPLVIGRALPIAVPAVALSCPAVLVKRGPPTFLRP